MDPVASTHQTTARAIPDLGVLPNANEARAELAHAQRIGSGLLEGVAGMLSSMGRPAKGLGRLALAAVIGNALIDEANAGMIIDKAVDASVSPRFGSTAHAIGGFDGIAGTTFENAIGPAYLNRFSFDLLLRDGINQTYIENWQLGDLGGNIHLLVRNSVDPVASADPTNWLSNTNVMPYASVEQINSRVNRVHLTLPDELVMLPQGDVTIALTSFGNLGQLRSLFALNSSRELDAALLPDVRGLFLDNISQTGYVRDFNAQRKEYWSTTLEYSPAAAVPEPSTLVLAGIGAAIVGGVAGSRALRRRS